MSHGQHGVSHNRFQCQSHIPLNVICREGSWSPSHRLRKQEGGFSHLRGRGPQLCKNKGSGALGSALVQPEDASSMQVPPQSSFQGQIVVCVEYQWLLDSFEIVV